MVEKGTGGRAPGIDRRIRSTRIPRIPLEWMDPMSWRLPSGWTLTRPEETAPTSGKIRAGPTATSWERFAPGPFDDVLRGSGPAAEAPRGWLPSPLATPAGGVAASGPPRKQERSATLPAASHIVACVPEPLRIPLSKQ